MAKTTNDLPVSDNLIAFIAPPQISERGILVTDGQYVVRYTDPGLSRLLGVPSDDLVGRSLLDVARIRLAGCFRDPDAYERHWQRLVDRPSESVEDVLDLAGEDQRVLHIYSAPLVDDHSALIGRVEVYSDITNRRRLEVENATLYQQVRSAYEELKSTQAQLLQSEKLRAVGEIASGVAHDFNNTLGIILGNVQLLLRSVQDSKTLSRLQAIEQAVRDGTETVRRMQEFTRVRPEDALCPVDLSEIAASITEMMMPSWQALMERKGIHLGLERDLGDGVLAVGIVAEIREVLTNILVNAVQAMPQGGRLRVVTSADDSFASVTVSDTGVGMSEEVQRRIFEPFFTTKGVEGTGLGMSVAYGIIKRHRGRIQINSVAGSGTSVCIMLPRSTGAYEPALVSSPSLPEPVIPSRILVIDDEVMFAEVLVDMLSQYGHTVEVASNGRDGLALFKSGGFDLVFTDLGMPGMSGWQVAEEVKRVDCAMPVILLTGWGAKVDSEMLVNSGVDVVLSKPVHMDELSAAVAEALARA